MKKYSLSAKSETVSLEGKNGETKDYVLQEMSAAARDRYVDRLQARMGVDTNGKPSLKRFEGMHADLLASCLFHSDDKRTPVTSAEIQSWPTSVVTELFNAAQLLNGLGGIDKQEPDLKNE